jgi:hypothetical protein
MMPIASAILSSRFDVVLLKRASEPLSLASGQPLSATGSCDSPPPDQAEVHVMRPRTALASLTLLGALALPATAADFSCNGLVPLGKKMICPGFEPNWAVELLCDSPTMTSNFIDAFSGSGIATTPGSVVFTSENPWIFSTSHPIEGSIAYTPAGCTDEGDNVHDFTFTPTAAPGLPGPFFPFCCRVE